MDQASSELLESLEAELDTWRKTPFDRLINRRDPLSALTAAVRHTRNDDQKRVRLDDIRALLITVVTAIEATQPAGVVPNSKGIVSNPAVIREVFGLTSDSKNATTRQRQEFAAHAVGSFTSWHTIRKYAQAHVDQLASWTRDYLDQLNDQVATTPKGETQTNLIDRRDELHWLHTTHRQLVTRGGIFLIWGLAGSGKTTLARQFAAQVAPDKFIGFIRIGRRGLYEEDIRRVLKTEGHDTSSWSDEHRQALFRAVARKLRTIRLLVFDDARDENDILSLIPESSSVPVLVTARKRLRFAQASSDTQPLMRQLLPFTTEQCKTFLRNQIPKLNANTISELAKILGGHAETMHHIIRYLTTDDALSPEALLEDLGRSTHRTLTDLTEVLEIPSGLPLILKQLYSQLADAPFANAILTSIIWTNSSGEQPRDLVIEIISELLHRPSALELQAAMHRLERLGLLTSTETSFSLPRLTCQILRDLLIDTCETVLIAYERVIAIPPESQQPKPKTLLQVLRQEYDFLRPLSPILAEKFGIMHTSPSALVALDDSNWALFTTSRSGRRQVEMYRMTLAYLLRLRPEAGQWETVTGDDIDLIVEITSHVYPMVEAEWRQMNTIT